MKKMITLLVATGFITVAFAQNGQYDQRNQQSNNGYQNQQNNGYHSQPNNGYQNQQNNGYQNQQNNGYQNQPNKIVIVRDDRHFDDHIMYRERDEQVERINREFNWKINSVSNRWFMSRERKEYEIRNLEFQKQQRISEVFARFHGHGDFHHDGFEKGRHW